MTRTVLISCLPKLNHAQQAGLLNLIKDVEFRGSKVHLWSDNKYGGELGKYDIEKLIFPAKEPRRYTRYSYIIKTWLRLDKKKWFERILQWINTEDKDQGKAQLLSYIKEAARVFANIQPDHFFCWNPYCCRFGVAYDAAKILGIKTLGIDWGFLPNTFILDNKGVLASSKIFNTNPLVKYNAAQLEAFTEKGRLIFADLKEKSLSLYAQAKAEIPADFEIIEQSEIRVLIIGIGEIDAGAYPAWHPERKGLLPFHHSSHQQALDIANTNPSYRVIFKPHPSHNRYPNNSRETANLAIVNGNPDELIDWADVVICSGSKMEFSAILKDKPLLTYGAGLLYGKNCSYEIKAPEMLAAEVTKALGKINDEVNTKNFITFLGYLDMEYLYNFAGNHNKVLTTVLQGD